MRDTQLEAREMPHDRRERVEQRYRKEHFAAGRRIEKTLSTMRARFAQVEIIAIAAESSVSVFETADCIYVKVQPRWILPRFYTARKPPVRIK